jgi:zinc transport system substrate-binding protein
MRPILTSLALLAAPPALAEPPQVVTDIAPVHSLVSMVMGELGTPILLLDAAQDPHHVTLRPSQARALTDAAAVVWIGPALTPWLEKPVGTLSDSATIVTLMDAPGTTLIAAEDHDHAEDGHEDDHHDGTDPHAWLDPHNAALWLISITATLQALDPENSETYAVNARTASAAIDQAEADIAARLAPYRDARFVVAHDAFAYFAGRFGLDLGNAISASDAAPPSAARMAELHDALEGVTCGFREPQQNPAALDALLAGTEIPQAILDPLGTALAPGPELYPDLLRAMADNIAACAMK